MAATADRALWLRRAWARAASFGGEAGSARLLAIQGTIWTLAAFGGAQALRLGASLLSTRLLFPELFGLMALVQTVHVGIALLSDVGLSVSIVRHKRGEERSFLDTAWTIQVIRGFGIWICCALAAPLAAAFYGEERLIWLLPLVGLNALIAGFFSTSIHLMRRRLAVRETVLLELGSQFVGLIVLIGWAWLEPSIMALVMGGLAASLTTLAGSHIMNRPHRDRFGLDREIAAELMSFGKWIFVSTGFTFLASQADRLLLGKLYSMHMLGVYNIAFNLADVPRALLLAVAGKVIFPMLARASEVPRDELRRKIARPRMHLLVVAAFGMATLVAFGDLLTDALYDERYDEANWMMPILAASVWFSFLGRTTDSMLLVVGRPNIPAIGFGLSFAAMIVGAIIGDRIAGEVGAVIGIALSPLPHYLLIAGGLRREGLSFLKQDLATTILFVALAVGILAVRSTIGPYPAVLAIAFGGVS